MSNNASEENGNGWYTIGGMIAGFLMATFVWLSVDNVRDTRDRTNIDLLIKSRLREAGAVNRCWSTVTAARDCRTVCPGFDPFAAEEIPK